MYIPPNALELIDELLRHATQLLLDCGKAAYSDDPDLNRRLAIYTANLKFETCFHQFLSEWFAVAPDKLSYILETRPDFLAGTPGECKRKWTPMRFRYWNREEAGGSGYALDVPAELEGVFYAMERMRTDRVARESVTNYMYTQVNLFLFRAFCRNRLNPIEEPCTSQLDEGGDLPTVVVSVRDKQVIINQDIGSYPARVVKAVAYMVKLRKKGKPTDRHNLLKDLAIKDSKKPLKDLLGYYKAIWNLIEPVKDSRGKHQNNKFVIKIDPKSSRVV